MPGCHDGKVTGAVLHLFPVVHDDLHPAGPTVIERNGERLDGRLPGCQGRLLFAHLVLNRHRLTSRDELVEALWPRQLPTATEAGLNALISKLRKILGPGVIDGRASLRLRLGDDSRVDVGAATEAVHRAESQVALGGWKRAWGPSLVALFAAEREFLPGEDAPWVDEQRQHLAEVRLRALEAYAVAALGIGGTELPAAVRAGRQLVRLVPLRESGHRVLMRALARQGNVAEALTVTPTCAWQLGRRTVSIWTTAGQVGWIRFACPGAQYERLTRHRKGEPDLLYRDGMWFLHPTCGIPGPPVTEPAGFTGVDPGIANIATTGDGTRHSGKYLSHMRHRHLRLRRRLQRKGTRSAKRLLRKRSRNEARCGRRQPPHR